MLDKLTYAGNLANLAPVAERSPRTRSSEGDIADADAARRAGARARRGRELRGRDPRRPVDRRAARTSCVTNVLGTQTPAPGRTRQPACPTFVQVSTDEVYGIDRRRAPGPRISPLLPNSPYSAAKAGG